MTFSVHIKVMFSHRGVNVHVSVDVCAPTHQTAPQTVWSCCCSSNTLTAVTDVAEINNNNHHFRISSPTFAAAGAGGAGAAGAVCPGRCEVRSLQARWCSGLGAAPARLAGWILRGRLHPSTENKNSLKRTGSPPVVGACYWNIKTPTNGWWGGVFEQREKRDCWAAVRSLLWAPFGGEEAGLREREGGAVESSAALPGGWHMGRLQSQSERCQSSEQVGVFLLQRQLGSCTLCEPCKSFWLSVSDTLSVK